MAIRHQHRRWALRCGNLRHRYIYIYIYTLTHIIFIILYTKKKTVTADDAKAKPRRAPGRAHPKGFLSFAASAERIFSIFS